MIREKTLFEMVNDEEWLVLVGALTSYIEYKEQRYQATGSDLFKRDLEIAKRLLKKLYNHE